MNRGRHILVVCLSPFENGVDGQRVRAWIEAEQAEGAVFTVLSSNKTLPIFKGLKVTIWPDGATNGLLRLLALVRRISWASFSAIYDLDMSRRTKAYRLFVRPCPPWHSGLD